MQIGLGCTVWAKGTRAGHMDGIGVYSQALWQSLNNNSVATESDDVFKPYAFGSDLPTLSCGKPRQLARSYPAQALLGGLLKVPLTRSARLRRDIDLFHATDHLIPRIYGVPTVATVMDLIPVLHPEWIKQSLHSLKSWLFINSIRKANHVITVSEYSKRDMVEHLGIDPENISVTPLGVDPVYFERVGADQRNAVLHKLGLEPGFFLFIGTLQPRKNLPRLLQAFQLLPLALRKAHPLIVVGRDGWSNEELLPQLHELEQQGEGRWLSYLPQSDVLALLQSAGALVFPSLYEGFGLPVIEAFAARCPVIASNTTSLPEVTGDAAWPVDPLSVHSIAEAMSSVVKDGELRQERIERGEARALQYTWNECARQTSEVYRKVLAGKH